MKKLIFILLLAPFLSFSATYYCATDGDNGNDGSIGSPWRYINYSCQQLIAGDSLFIRAGTYYGADTNLNYIIHINAADDDNNGTESDPIVVINYPDETVIINGDSLRNKASSVYLLTVYETDYWHFIGLNITGANDLEGEVYGDRASAAILTRTKGCRVERCNFYGNDGRGLDIYGGHGQAKHADSNLVLNCDAYSNCDTNSAISGGNADGFGIIYTEVGDTNYIRGCRAWDNSDDGFDFISSDGVVIMDSCWATINGKFSGDGCGIKLGSYYSGDVSRYIRIITRCVSFENKTRGIHANYMADAGKVKIYNNTILDNGGYGIDFNSCYQDVHIFKNNITDGHLPWDVGLDTIHDESYNSWNMSPNSEAISGENYYARTDINSANQFVSVDSATIVDLIKANRQENGNLPSDPIPLKAESVYVDAGIDVGLFYNGSAPDLGAFEYVTLPITSGNTLSTYHYIPDFRTYYLPAFRTEYITLIELYPSIIDDGNTEGWFIAESDYVTTDANDSVTVWADNSGNNNDLLATDETGECPVWYIGDSIVFDGIGNYMFTGNILSLDQPVIYYMVVKLTNYVSGSTLMAGTDGASAAVYEASGNRLRAYAGATLTYDNGMNYDEWMIVRVQFDGASSFIKVNDSEDSGDTGANDPNGIAVGNDGVPTSGEFCEMVVREIIVRMIDEESGNETDIYNYLKNKYGI